MDINFKHLTIICDAESRTTHIIADGKELGKGCTSVLFEHDANENYISLHTRVKLTPRLDCSGCASCGD